MATVTTSIPARTYSLTNQREHWAKKARRAKQERGWAKLTGQAARLHLLELPLTITLTRVAPRALDDDNLRGSLKSIRDGIADCLGMDDRDARVVWRYAQRRGDPREYAVEIEAKVK